MLGKKKQEKREIAKENEGCLPLKKRRGKLAM